LNANGEVTIKKRSVPGLKPDEPAQSGEAPPKRPRGRPKGSKNKNKGMTGPDEPVTPT
jgi:hypothetical protein